MAKGLGTGLGALFGEEAVDNITEFDYLPIAKVEPRKGQPRTVFAEDELQELADSISEHGILQPLTVRRLDGGYYQIIAGERRWRAARMAGLKTVPARIIEADDKKTMELALVENLQREGLNVLEEALGFKTLMEEYGMTQADVAEKVSKSRPYIANALRLLGLPKALHEKLESGSLSAGAARALLALEDDALMIKAANDVINLGMSVRQTESYVRKLKTQTGKKRDKSKGDTVSYAKIVENDLTKALGRKVTLHDGAKKGKVEIEFYGYEDLDVLIDQLKSVGGKRAGK